MRRNVRMGPNVRRRSRINEKTAVSAGFFGLFLWQIVQMKKT